MSVPPASFLRLNARLARAAVPRSRPGIAGWWALLALTLATALQLPASTGVGQERFAAFEPVAGGFPLVEAGRVPTLHVDSADHEGVQRVARDLQADIKRVTGLEAAVSNQTPSGRYAIVIGTAGRSGLIRQLEQSGKLDLSGVTGKWEVSLVQVVDQPFQGVERALVIVGSDKRGTIYGTYDVSQQIGVSPWYWWADVPVTKREAVFIKPGRHLTPEPVVRYRGLFLNDEAPALSGWATEKFGGFNGKFYRHVFELILRLRGNYLWPAMWGSAFNDDDAQNPAIADQYGVVMGTSHHEPLMRAHDEWRRYGKGDWNYGTNEAALREFWRGGVERVKDFEKIVSMGMRGDGDEAMSEETNVALLERIVADQRKILAEVTGKPAEEVPQLWALYKEVQTYYENGMRVPDDVTLLWCDDNWGNVRRLPTPAETRRKGGAGMYYHFDYVGGPRNYKWLNTVPLSKIWEQMHLTWRHDANRIWIVNVGDLKPMEFPIEFFLTYAWNPAAWPYERVEAFSERWAAREFGPEHATEAAALVNGYTRLNGRRKPEMLAPDTYSFVNYREAERVSAEWAELVRRAEVLNEKVRPEARDAFFQLVLYPVKASATVQEIHFAAGLNRWYVRQGRSDANGQADRARQLFQAEGELARAYHTLNGGKWNHMMAQVKMGYTYWQQPDIESMPAVSEVRPRAGSSMGVSIEGSETAYPSYGARRAVLPPLSAARDERRWIEVFNRGVEPFTFTVTADQPWVLLSTREGRADRTVRLEVGVAWDQVPAGRTEAAVTLKAATGETSVVHVPVVKEVPETDRAVFVEVDGHVAIEAPNYSRRQETDGVSFNTLAGFGRTLGAVTLFPVTPKTRTAGRDAPWLEYDIHLASTGEVTLELQCAPSLDYQPGMPISVAVAIDDATPQVLKLDTWQTNQTWEAAVANGVRRVLSRHPVGKPGTHVLKIWMLTPGVVLQRVILDAGGVRPSYLGPIESPRVPAAR